MPLSQTQSIVGTNTGDETGPRIGTLLHAATAKTTPVDADEVTGLDSAASFGLIRMTWANVKATLKAYFDSLYPSGSGTHSGTSSGTNTGDNAVNSLYSGLVTNATHTGDVTGSGALTIAPQAVTYAKMQNISATARALGRNTAGAGSAEEVTLSQMLDWVGSAAQGDILYRGASGWVRLPAGTSGQYLQTAGPAANPTWATVAGGGSPGGSTTQVQYNNAGAFGGANLWVESANVAALRNGVNAQSLYVYKTYTDASNYERLSARWTSNVAELGTEALGTGTLRGFRVFFGGPNNYIYGQDTNNLFIRANLSLRIDVTAGAGGGAIFTQVSDSFAVQGITIKPNGNLIFNRAGTPKINVEDAVIDEAIPDLLIQGATARSTATTNLVGRAINIQAGSGASGSAGAAHAGAVNIAGGIGYGTGTAGVVNLAYTGSAARGSVKVWSNLTVTGVVGVGLFTVATLPSASTSGNGARAHVSDALAPTFGSTVAAGGAVSTPVYSDGTNWKVG